MSFYIGTLPKSACDYSYLVIDTTSPSASAEHNIGFGENGAGQGYSITNNPGNIGACTTGKLDPLSFSQGQWDMPPGQFTGAALSSTARPAGPSAGGAEFPLGGMLALLARRLAGEGPRDGRWAGRAKAECGIHVVDAAMMSSEL